ncbi:peroxisomal biogenesis factor 3-like [Mizuhopecten yessoensis]|uniref:Peroxisomal biogenesis factor 3 n=1 Tax=Mizuhopecten yessoensis TaxID=6573 RepID=A0A210QLQ0_MIZYE|nr:peroxisomal biogenesis factor 3-like [Mizuhopecten yessoensis]OWF49669.1 Peroxisomal biogenesis factor 3 [Mizuhopecten yessoensis]
MFTSMWNFIKRHKKKFVFSGFLVGGGVYLYKYAQRRFKDIQEKEAAECLKHARQQHHFDSNQRTCNMTVISMLPTLREALIKKFDTDAVKESLKNSPENKLELWEKLKVMSLTRIICVLYGCSILCLVLRVQLNIVGGYMFLDSMFNRNGMTQNMAVVPKELQERYLSLIRHFMDYGLFQLCDVIHEAVEKEIKSVSLKERLSFHNLKAISDQIRERIESSPEISDLQSPTLMLCTYMLPSESHTSMETENAQEKMYQQLVQETRDVLESPDFHAVLHTCLNRGFAKLLDSMADHYREAATDQQQNLHEVGIPMAKLVPVMSGLMFKLCSDTPNPLIQELLLLDQTKTLAANIYEAFSQQEELAAIIQQEV